MKVVKLRFENSYFFILEEDKLILLHQKGKYMKVNNQILRG